MAFHKCQRWWRNGFADCPYLTVPAHSKTDEDDEDQEEEPVIPKGVPVKVPDPVGTKPEAVKHRVPNEFEPKWVPPAKKAKAITVDPILLAIEQGQLELPFEEELVKAVAKDQFGAWKTLAPVLQPAVVPVPALAMQPVIEGAFKASAAPTPAGVVEATVAAAYGYAASAQIAGAAAAWYQNSIAPVAAVAAQEASQVMTMTPPEDYFGVQGPAEAAPPTYEQPESFLETWEIVLLGAAAVGTAAVVVAGGGGGLFFNWAAELEGLMGGSR